MTKVTLGFTPHDLDVILTRGADFFTTIKKKTGDWDPGVAITLVLGGTSFPFTIDGDDATLVIDKADVETVINARTTKAKVLYNQGSADVTWMMGDVISSG